MLQIAATRHIDLWGFSTGALSTYK